MTRKEAIEILEGEKCRQWSNVKEAFDVAINSLKTDELYDLAYENPDALIDRKLIEDIKAEIIKTVEEETQIDKKWSSGLKYALQIIDKHIGG